jgi:co-chaperonin GroES (HSP10)
MQIETFLDMFLIEEIPVENATSTGIVGIDGQEVVRSQRAAKKPTTGKVVSCGKQFPYNGMMIDNPYKVGDIVRTNEFGRDYQVLNQEDEFRPGAVKFYLIRYDDIQGRVKPPARNQPPWERFKSATCRGCYALGTACGTCEKCAWERENMAVTQ